MHDYIQTFKQLAKKLNEIERNVFKKVFFMRRDFMTCVRAETKRQDRTISRGWMIFIFLSKTFFTSILILYDRQMSQEKKKQSRNVHNYNFRMIFKD